MTETGRNWARNAREYEWAMVLVGPAPRLAEEDVHGYVRRYITRSRKYFFAAGFVELKP